MPGIIQKNVFRLEISIDHVESMQTFEGAKKLGCVESRSVNIESLFSLKMMEQFSAVDESQDKV